MSLSSDPCSAAWVEQEVTRVLGGHSAEDIATWMPIITLLMARDFGYENLEPETKAAIAEGLARIGATGRESKTQIHDLVLEYTRALPDRATLVAEIAQVLRTHDRALSNRVRRAERVLDRRPARLSVHQLGAVRPAATETGAALARRTLGHVRP